MEEAEDDAVLPKDSLAACRLAGIGDCYECASGVVVSLLLLLVVVVDVGFP